MFTTDTCPVKEQKIIKAGTLITEFIYFKAPQRSDFQNKDNFLQLLGRYILDVETVLTKSAISKGYNAIIGYKLTITPSYNGFGSSTVNNMEGIGYSLITAQGVPVLVK